MKGIMKENYSKSLFFSLVALIILVMLVISISLATFVYSKKGTITNTIQTGTLMMTYTEGATGIKIDNALPMSDEVGKTLSEENEMFQFTVSSTIRGNTAIRYEITAIKKDTSTLSDDAVKLYLERSSDGVNYLEAMKPTEFTPLATQSSLGSPVGSMIIESGTFTKTQTNHYILRMWLKEEITLPNIPQQYAVTVNVYGSI